MKKKTSLLVGLILLPILAFTQYTGGSYDGHAMSTMSDTPLPVELTSFTAIVCDVNITLYWTTESEIENLGFIIKRKNVKTEEQESEIASYKTHSELQGQGSTTNRTEYQFTDTDVQPDLTYEYRLIDVDYSGDTKDHGTCSVTFKSDDQLLKPAYPNPFNPVITIQFNLLKAQQVTVSIYDLQGREIRTLIDGWQEVDSYSLKWNGRNNNGIKLSSGIYFIVMRAKEMTESQKIALLR